MRNEIACTHDRSCHQLGKERDIKSIIQQTGQRRYLATVHIYRVTQRLESEERNAHRQEYVQRFKESPCQRGKESAQEVGVLKITQQAQIDAQADPHPRLAQQRNRFADHQPGNKEIANGDKPQQEKVSAATLVIEVVGKQSDKQQTCRSAMLQHQIDQHEGGKQPKKDTATENHRYEHTAQPLRVYVKRRKQSVNIPHNHYRLLIRLEKATRPAGDILRAYSVHGRGASVLLPAN